MVQTKGKKENQHYVPQFLLRNFSRKRKNQNYIFVYDKHNDSPSYESNVSGIVTEKGFYDFYIGEEIKSVEPILQKLEDNALIPINKIIENKNVSCISCEEKEWLFVFISLQYMRVKKQRETIKIFIRKMKELVRKTGKNPKDVKGFHTLSDEEIKTASIKFFIDNLKDVSQLIASKNILLFQSSNEESFYISDNPVTLHNDNEYGPYGNIGLGVKGIQIYLPISSTLSLAFWCPSICRARQKEWNNLQNNIKKLDVLLVMNPLSDKKKIKEELKTIRIQELKNKKLIDGLNEGLAIETSSQNVTFINSLQVESSQRFVMCKKDNFKLVRRMIEDNDLYREGMRLRIN